MISFRLRYRPVFGSSLQNVTVFCKKVHTVTLPLPTVTNRYQALLTVTFTNRYWPLPLPTATDRYRYRYNTVSANISKKEVIISLYESCKTLNELMRKNCTDK